MNWNVIKLHLLDALLRILANKMWPLAQKAVALLQQRDDLIDDDKRALARANLQAEVRELGVELANGAANFLIECALQYLRGRFGDTGVER